MDRRRQIVIRRRREAVAALVPEFVEGSTAGTDSAGGGAVTLSNFECPAGVVNGIIGVAVSHQIGGSAPRAITGITWNGTNAVEVDSATSIITNTTEGYLWYFRAPEAGATSNMVVSFASSQGATIVVAGVWQNVADAVHEAEGEGIEADPLNVSATSVTSSALYLSVLSVNSNSPFTATQAGQTIVAERDRGAQGVALSWLLGGAAGSHTLGYTGTSFGARNASVVGVFAKAS